MRPMLTLLCLLALLLVPAVQPSVGGAVTGNGLTKGVMVDGKQTLAAANDGCDQSGVSTPCGATLAVLCDTAWCAPRLRADIRLTRGDTDGAQHLASPNRPPPRRIVS